MEAQEPYEVIDQDPEQPEGEPVPENVIIAGKPIYTTETPGDVPAGDRTIRNLIGRSIT